MSVTHRETEADGFPQFDDVAVPQQVEHVGGAQFDRRLMSAKNLSGTASFGTASRRLRLQIEITLLADDVGMCAAHRIVQSLQFSVGVVRSNHHIVLAQLPILAAHCPTTDTDEYTLLTGERHCRRM